MKGQPINTSVLKGSLLVVTFFGIFNLLNFAFHFFMARQLSVSDYGILATLFSMIYALGFFTESIQIVVTKYVTIQKKDGLIKNLMRRSFRKATFFSLILFGSYLLVCLPLSRIMEIDYLLLSINGLGIFAVFLLPINRAVLQGRKRFSTLGLNMVLESLVKLVLSVVFVYLGWKVYGAIIGTLLGSVAAYFVSFVLLRNITRSKELFSHVEGIYAYTRPAFFTIMGIALFYSFDIILAKILFPSEVSGSYAIASILAKTIFLVTQPISKVMFPLSVENKFYKKKSNNIFKTSLLIIFVPIFSALALFFLFPEIIINIFSGKSIPEIYVLLPLLGIGNSFLAITNLILIYKLSLGNTKGHYFVFLFVVLELFLLTFFSSSLLEFSTTFAISSGIFLIGALFMMNK